MEEKKVEEEVVQEVKKGDGEEGEEEDEQAQVEELDEDKKKDAFNPEEFEWTVSNGNPKNLAQLFFKKKDGCNYVSFVQRVYLILLGGHDLEEE